MRTSRVDIIKMRDTLAALHTLTLPGDYQPSWNPKGMAWITWHDGEPVAFLFVEPCADQSWYFSRVGVMPAARGQGLQRKLMRLMCRALVDKVLVSTTYRNPPSANNFIREQWMTYLPAEPWGSPDTIYWRRDPCSD